MVVGVYMRLWLQLTHTYTHTCTHFMSVTWTFIHIARPIVSIKSMKGIFNQEFHNCEYMCEFVNICCCCCCLFQYARRTNNTQWKHPMNEYTMYTRLFLFSSSSFFGYRTDRQRHTKTNTRTYSSVVLCSIVYMKAFLLFFFSHFFSLCKSNQNYSLLSNTSINERKVFRTFFLSFCQIYIIIIVVVESVCVCKKEMHLIECD